jgi:hypothetical protein
MRAHDKICDILARKVKINYLYKRGKNKWPAS